MRPNRTWLRAATSLVFLVTTFATQAAAQKSENPALSAEIRTLLEKDGIEAAQTRFDEIFPAQKDKYEIDTQAFAQLATEYMTAGDHKKGEAVMNMLAAITQDMIASGGVPGGPAGATWVQKEPPEQEEPEPARPAAKASGPDFGPAREDLARFAGVYGDPEQADPNRKLFVTVSCDGYLVAGAMWGDAQNWWMKSLSDNTFEMKSDFMSVRLEFQIGSDGNAQAMNHDLDFMPNPLQKVGPLPDGWGECVRRPGG